MIKTKKLFILLAVVCGLISENANAQNIFPQVVGNCKVSKFCLDCGSPPANIDTAQLSLINEKISESYNLKSIRGMVMLQVLVDSLGSGCVLSHTDKSNSPLVLDIVKYLNNAKWTPAIDENKATTSSINVAFRINHGKVTSQIQRVDNLALFENMKNPGTPTIYNKTYSYKNAALHTYNIKVWQKENSDLPQDMSQHNVIDGMDAIWYATLNGFTKFDGKTFYGFNQLNSPFKANADAHSMAINKHGDLWLAIANNIYEYTNNSWAKLDSDKIGANDANHIICTDNGEVLFCTDYGLVIYKGGKYNVLDTKVLPQLPSNRVDFACRDKQNRLWIGTFSGTIMIDANNNITDYNKGYTPLNGNCITAMAEDENGNIYFSLYTCVNSTERDRDSEGLAKLSPDNTWAHYNDKNSGLPANRINSLMYDRFEKLLWIGTNEAGLVRFDLKDGWENYHNQNSGVPSTYIYDISQDSKGSIFVSTYDGMMRITKK